ncbi:MAG: nuclear transport factor 2 family protein [Burkholderiales bacterium]|nr:nuclear transport factor 2 family protein [Burkholderiales bacterium]MDE2298379.1 nuclear transport factor 2 family protein [Burkholderiales bacterium]MDE2625672.1 nuclear transport factor 2 family protein [Burkholderiales bacterium]
MVAAHHPPAVAATLATWHRMIESRDLGELPALLHPDAIFRSPMAFTPYESAAAVNLVLTTVIGVFEDFRYHRELIGVDGLDAMLEFSARVGDKQLKGIDLIRFDTDGRIKDFEVMIRPLSGLQALGDEMGRRIGPMLAAFKSLSAP